jgi:hypothetical protein
VSGQGLSGGFRLRKAGRLGLLVVGLFSGLLLKGLSHVLIALDVPAAHDLLAVSHVVIAVLTAAILLKVVLRQARISARERKARRALDAALERGAGTATQQAVEPLVSSGAVPAAVAGTLADEEGSVYAFGDADERMLFEIGSLSKVFTALMLADMAGRGEVSLEERLDQILPTLEGAGAGEITLEALATHHSGLPRLPSRLIKQLLAQTLRQDDPTADPYAESTPERLEDDLRRLRRRGRASRFRYSNFGYAALGLALSRVAGLPYERPRERARRRDDRPGLDHPRRGRLAQRQHGRLWRLAGCGARAGTRGVRAERGCAHARGGPCRLRVAGPNLPRVTSGR